MKVGLRSGARGIEVERLHRALRSRGIDVERGEIERGEFGPSTLAALHSLQEACGLTVADEIDEETLEILVEIEQNITININEAPPQPPKPNPRRGVVRGKLVGDDGDPIAGAPVALFSQQLRGETQVGRAVTGAAGQFIFHYRRTQPLNLLVRAYDDASAVIATSQVSFAAPPVVEIDLTTAKDGVVRTPSTYTTLVGLVTAALEGMPLAQLIENKQTHQLSFLAKSIARPFNDVAYLYMAALLGSKESLRDETLFGIFEEGIPASLDAALANLPDAGIDASFISQVMAGVLGQSRATLSAALTTAVGANVLPASYADTQDLELSQIDDLRTQSVAASPYIRGKTPLSDLLAAGNVAATVTAAFTQAYAANAQRLGPTWKAVRADKSLSKADLDTLKTTLSAGELLGGNLPLVKDTLGRLAQGSLASVRNLALLDENDWIARINQVDPQAASIPAVLPDDTVQLRISRFAKALAQRFASRYPTTSFAGSLSKATSTSFKTQQEMVSFIVANPSFNFKRTNVDQYVATNAANLSPAAVTELKTAQRLHRVSPHYTSVEALNTSGFTSAQAIYFQGRDTFIAQMTQPLGSAPLAKMAYARAQMVYSTALMAYGRYNLALNGVGVAAMGGATPPKAALDNLPDLQALFGSLDYFQCQDCQSVYSPAAYLVDLLQYLVQFSASGAASNARDALLVRRPDLQYIALDCNNTNITLPYIDLVNEILEAAIAPPESPPTLIDTTGTSDERRALPQNIWLPAYAKTALAIFPLNLPFDLAFAQTTAYLTALGTSLPAVLSLFAGAPGGPSAVAIAGASLGINPEMTAVIDSVSTTPWTRWGLAQNGNAVIDPKTRALFPAQPNTTDWVTILNKVPILLNRAGLSLQQLYQLLEVAWVTQGGVTLQPGTTTLAGVSVLDADTDNMILTGLTGPVLDRANRFLRLWSASGLEMWELDWALEASFANFDDFLVYLADAIAAQKRLKLPFQEVLSFWNGIETRDVVNHLGDEDTVASATYSEVFRSPTMLSVWSSVFVDLTAPGAHLSGVPIAGNIVSAINAALGLSGDDITAILTATGTPSTFDTTALNVLFRYARLSAALSLSIPDLILWIQLTQGQPFGGSPADTLEFLRRLAVLQGTGLAVHDLDYLLRGQSAAASSIAFTADEASAVLQSIRAAIVKLPAAELASPTAAGTQADISDIFLQALASALNVTTNVVTPLLAKTGALPLSAATIGQLVDSSVPLSSFPALTAAFTQVAMGAALFTAIGPTESELAFLAANAGTFGWLDPSALPPAGNAYALLEALLRALKLNRRQSARTPRWFDVLTAWLPPGALPPNVAIALAGSGATPSLALALNASAADAQAVATYLGATAPNLTPVTGSLCDVAVLTALTAALDLGARYKVSGATLVQLATVPATTDTASAAKSALQAQFPQSAWFGAVRPVEDKLRESRRDALVGYLLGPGPAKPIGATFLSSDDIYDYYLIDPEMSACALSTRLLQASLAIQQFVQQCFLNLSFGSQVDTTNPHWSEWSWRGQFRLWQANRQVFLYPENYVLPELRKDASPFFTDLENDLRQSNLDSDAAQTAFEIYLRKLLEVARLVVAAHYYETRADGSRVLHVFARTRVAPHKWFYRTRTEITPGAGVWEAWQPLNLDIAPDNVLPFIWDQRLHLLWVIYKQQSEKASNQPVPPGGGGTQPPAQSYWSMELAMSELSAGLWQAKRTIGEKIYVQKTEVIGDTSLMIDRPPLGFTLRASQDPQFNLQVNVYYNLSDIEIGLEALGGIFGGNIVTPLLIANAAVSMPDSPAVVTEDGNILPAANLIDLSHEPSYALVTQHNFNNGTLATPNNYNFAGQDLVYGFYFQNNPGTVPLWVLARTSASGQPKSVELLGRIQNPHIVIPQQEPVFDSLDPFFIIDPERIYLVQPEFFSVSSHPVELEDLTYVKQWSTSFAFQTFYHPYARTFLRELEIGGMPQLMSRSLQLNPQAVRNWPTTFNFANLYDPQAAVAKPYPGVSQTGDPGETWLDFTPGSAGPYSLYNWEIFYHAPMFVASLLMQNQRFDDTLTWLEFIFNPTDSSGGAAPQRFWEMAPFFLLNANDWANQEIQTLLATLAADTQQHISDPATTAAINTWMADPFDPHAIASLRITAYAKATVMKFLDNLIAWGDSLFAQFDAESVGQAEQLYVLADMLLGPKPEELRIPNAGGTPQTYATLKNVDAFSNALVQVENVIVAPTPPQALIQGTAQPTTLPQFPGGSPSTLLFCIPPNDKLLSYWDTVADRLFKIRNCMNLQGVVTPLPLYAPPINPLLLVEAGAAGASISGAAPTAPIYRFQTYLQKAVELTNDVRAYGSLILSALEKKDAETLSVLRANQELDIQTRTLDVKNRQVTEAQDQITVLQNQQAVVQIRFNFYSNIAFMNAWEIAALSLQGAALIANGVAIILDMTAGVAHVVPSFQGGACGFGGSPAATVNYGGDNVGKASTSWATVARGLGGLLSEAGGIAGTLGSYNRRSDEWSLQAQLAQAELTQIASQITAANDRLGIAQSEVDIQNRQIANSQAVSDFLTNKYTNAALYDFMITQLTTVYTQAYQLAFSLAQQAQNAYQYELGRPQDTFIQFGYWDSQHKGLTAGESLLFDLRRMEAQYLAENAREQEMTKNVSLALTQPMALVTLRETGSCQISLDEALFDRDNPGQYFRRLCSVALTIPCVVGPYTSLNATLTLTSALVRVTPPVPGYTPVAAGSGGDGVHVVASASPATATIATSTGQNDAGLFELSLKDERWLPFEGQGAISQWTLVLDARDNSVDLSTVTDVILHVRFTARGAGDQVAANAVRTALKPLNQRSILVSARNTFGDDWFTFFNPIDPTAAQQSLVLPLQNALFPFANFGTPKLAGITLVFVLTKAQPPGTSIAASFGPTGGPAAALSITASTSTDGAGNPVAAMSSPQAAATVAPESFTLTVPEASVPPTLGVTVSGHARLDPAQIEDVLVLINYSIV
jgi:hypothetical protein